MPLLGLEAFCFCQLPAPGAATLGHHGSQGETCEAGPLGLADVHDSSAGRPNGYLREREVKHRFSSL